MNDRDRRGRRRSKSGRDWDDDRDEDDNDDHDDDRDDNDDDDDDRDRSRRRRRRDDRMSDAGGRDAWRDRDWHDDGPRVSGDTRARLMYDANKKSVLVAYLLWFFLRHRQILRVPHRPWQYY